MPPSHATPRPQLPERLPLRLQDLPPDAARFCLRVGEFMTAQLAHTPENVACPPCGSTASSAHALRGSMLLAGVSGGADSLAMLLALRWLAPRLGFGLSAAVLDHGLRTESAGEARAVTAACRRLGVPCRTARADVAELARREACGTEDAGRRARYAFFEAERRRLGATWVCTAHQLDDLCEDVLLRLVRGSGWPALGGMRAVDATRHILRPLLLTERRGIEAFLAELGVLAVHDPSNDDLSFRRNRMRHSVLPLLRAENPAFGQSVRNLWELARCDADYWRSRLEGLTATCDATRAVPPHAPVALQSEAGQPPGAHAGKDRSNHDAACPPEAAAPEAAAPDGERGILLAGHVLRALHRAERLRVYKHLLEQLGPGQALSEGLLRLDDAWCAGRGGACVQFPGGKTARIVSVACSPRNHGGIRFEPGPET